MKTSVNHQCTCATKHFDFQKHSSDFCDILFTFSSVSIAEAAEFCIKDVLISPNILNHSQLLSPTYTY